MFAPDSGQGAHELGGHKREWLAGTYAEMGRSIVGDQLYRNVKFSDEVKRWIGFDTMKTLNVMGMRRWVTNHRRGAW